METRSTIHFWQVHADAHDFPNIGSASNIADQVFASHFGHLAIVLAWLSALFFAGARFSNYESWLISPLTTRPLAQIVYPGSAYLSDSLNSIEDGLKGIKISTAVFWSWRSAGFTTSDELLQTAFGCLLLAIILVIAGHFHYHRSTPARYWFNQEGTILNHHLAAVIGLGSIAWSGHLLHVSLPVDALLNHGIVPNGSSGYLAQAGTIQALLGCDWSDLSELLTFRGSLSDFTGSIVITDLVHHHLAVGVVGLVAGHLYQSHWHLGTPVQSLLAAHRSHFVSTWNSQLAINLGAIGTATILAGHILSTSKVYPYLASDPEAILSLFTHHCWIGALWLLGSGAHAAIFVVSEYQVGSLPALDRVLSHRHSIISHLNWACIFLGFHAFGLYIHNDCLLALGRAEDTFADGQIELIPFIAVMGQRLIGSLSLSSEAIAGSSVLNLGTTDFLVHHIHAFTIHVTMLILLKGVLFGRSSSLISDKRRLGFRYPWDGPGRGGTWQISSWDHTFLGAFWVYNCVSVVIFHFSWKIQSSSLAGSQGYISGGSFERSAGSINGWLRDFLWSQASQVIQSYGSAAGSYGLIFLAAHFIWAFSLMFLFSGRGYWQELIESITWSHNTLGVAPNISPRALSITQGRAVGLAHYFTGGTITTWSFFQARLIE